MKIADKFLFQIIIFLILMIYCAFCAKSFIFVIISVVLFIIMVFLLRIIYVNKGKNNKRWFNGLYYH